MSFIGNMRYKSSSGQGSNPNRENAETARLLQRMDILTLQVLDHGRLQRRAVRHLDDADGDGLHLRETGRAKPTRPGHDREDVFVDGTD